MSDDAGFAPFLKLNAGKDEKGARGYEWALLQEVKGRDEGILGLRLVEDPGGVRAEDLVHLLVSPHCSRERLAASLQMPEVRVSPKYPAGPEPGHFLPVNADRLNQAVRAEYFARLQEMSEGARTRQATPEEVQKITRIRGTDTTEDVPSRHPERFFPVGDLPPEGRPDRLGAWRSLRQLQKVLTPSGTARLGGESRPLFFHGRVLGDQVQVILPKSNLTTARVMLEALGLARSEAPALDELTDRLPESGEINRHTHCVMGVTKARFEYLLEHSTKTATFNHAPLLR